MTAPAQTPPCRDYPRGATLLCHCGHQEHATSAECAGYHKTGEWPRHCEGRQMIVRRLRDR